MPLRSWLFLVVMALGLGACIGVDELDDTITAVVVQAEQTALLVGEQTTWSATLRNGFGDEFAGDISWKSDAPTVVEVSAAGVLRAVAVGQARITAIHQNLASSPVLVTVTASDTDLARIEISPNQLDPLAIGQTRQLQARAFDLGGRELTGLDFVWTSSQPAVASVGAGTGLLTALANGQTEVWASVAGLSSTPVAISVGSQARFGQFAGANGYNVGGSVVVEPVAGANQVRINLNDNFSSQSGPGLYVYLTHSASTAAGGREAGKLQANSGAQVYTVSNVGITDYNYVMILCKPFNVPFGSALLN